MSCTATLRANITARMNAIGKELAEMDSSKVGGKPNVLTQDGGTTIDHVGYRKSLLDELASLAKALSDLPAIEAAMENDQGPFEFSTITDV